MSSASPNISSSVVGDINCLVEGLRSLPPVLGHVIADYLLPDHRVPPPGVPASYSGREIRRLMMRMVCGKARYCYPNLKFKDLSEVMHQIILVSFTCCQNKTTYMERMSFYANFEFRYAQNIHGSLKTMTFRLINRRPIEMGEYGVRGALNMAGIAEELVKDRYGEYAFDAKTEYEADKEAQLL